MRSRLKEKFISHEVMLNNLSAQRESERERATSQLFIEQSQSTTPIYYSLLPQAKCHPRVADASPGIDIPIQADLTLGPGESQTTESGIQFYIPAGFYMQLAPRLSAFELKHFTPNRMKKYVLFESPLHFSVMAPCSYQKIMLKLISALFQSSFTLPLL